MAVTSFRQLRKLTMQPSQRIRYTSDETLPSAGTNADSQLCSGWVTASRMPSAGVAPGAAAVPTRATAGAVGQANASAGTLYAFLERFGLAPAASGNNPGMILLVDRLAHNSGLSGIVTTAQSNGAWPALTRYTSGLNVWAAAEVYTAIGATQTTITMSYTNEAGVAGRTSQPVKIGGTGRNATRRLLPMSLQGGDKGVRSVADVTLAATTGSAGDFGVTLFRTIGAWPVSGLTIVQNGKPFPNFGSICPVVTDACLQFLFMSNGSGGALNLGCLTGFFEA